MDGWNGRVQQRLRTQLAGRAMMRFSIGASEIYLLSEWGRTGTGTTRQDACMDVAAASGDGGVGTDRDRMEGAA
jgi:hypothetical protein